MGHKYKQNIPVGKGIIKQVEEFANRPYNGVTLQEVENILRNDKKLNAMLDKIFEQQVNIEHGIIIM